MKNQTKSLKNLKSLVDSGTRVVTRADFNLDLEALETYRDAIRDMSNTDRSIIINEHRYEIRRLKETVGSELLSLIRSAAHAGVLTVDLGEGLYYDIVCADIVDHCDGIMLVAAVEAPE